MLVQHQAHQTISFIAISLTVLSGAGSAAAQVDVLTQHNDLSRTGSNLHEAILTPFNVNVQEFGLLFKRVVDDQVYGQPLYASNVTIEGGTHDIVYITTVNNSVYAFDANEARASTPLWHVNFGTPASLSDGKFGCSDMNGDMGIVGTPVIDAAKKTLYVVALTKTAAGFVQRLHALDTTTGADLSRSPVVIQARDFNALKQNQRPALLLSHGLVYVGYSSHCDKDPYHGFLMAYDARSLKQIAVLNTSPTGEEASIWQSGQAPAVDGAGNVYVVTGNGTWDGKTNFSESFLKLSPRLKILDWFTPTNHFELDKKDNDLNSSGATLIPGTDLILGGGKEGVMYVLNRDHLGHLGDENAVEHFQATVSHMHSLVYWKSDKDGPQLYVWGQRDRAKVYRLAKGRVEQSPVVERPEVNQGHPGAMLSLSADAGKAGILWAAIHATGDSWHESRPGVLHAFDADDIQHELWNSLENPSRDDCNNYSKMAPPTIANGKVYLASFGTANTNSGQFCVYGLLQNGPAPAAPTRVEAIAGLDDVYLSWAPSAKAKTYNVKVAVSNAEGFTTIALGLTSPHFKDEAATSGHTYRYIVTAVNANGESAPADVASAALPRSRTTSVVNH